MPATLNITDGTTTINLITDEEEAAGFYLDEWVPAVADYKGGGVWQDPPLAEGRRLVDKRFGNAVETFRLKARGTDQDGLIRQMQDIRRLLEKAADYWTTEWQDEPVWVEAQASCETNKRYAVVHRGRIPEDDNPYSQPFLQPEGAIFDNLTLVVERGHWLADQPGTGTCVEISAMETYCWPSYLEFDGATSSLNLGSPPKLDDLPDFAVAGKGQITVDGWIRADSYGSGGVGRIADKTNAAVNAGFVFLVSNANGLWGLIYCAGGAADSRSGLDDFTADGQWHHVLMTYDETGAGTPAARTIYFAVDGVWVAAYTTQTASIGNYNPDNAESLYLGCRQGGLSEFDGGIGWMRVSDSVRYAVGVNFTAPARCTLPDPDAATMWLGIYEGQGTTAHDLSATPSNGTIANAPWDCDCELPYGNVDDAGVRDPTCEDEVYAANKRNEANITNVHYWDSAGGAWSGNLMNAALPFALLTNPVAAGDVVVFGIDTNLQANGDPTFCSLVFDILAAIADVTAITWRYSRTGADPAVNWPALTVQDNTNADGAMTGVAFDTTGVKSVHWEQPSDWAAFNPQVGAGPALGVTGLWVAAHVTAVGGAPTPPTQQHRDIYSVVWPYIEVASDLIEGDIVPLLRARIRNQSDGDFGSGGTAEIWGNRILVGLRSYNRGADFRSRINLSDEQNDPNITVTALASSAFANSATASTGRIVRTTNTNPAWSNEVSIAFAGSYANQYRGIFQVFLRVDITSGIRTDLTMRLVFNTSNANIDGIQFTTPEAQAQTTSDWAPVSFGMVQIPPSSLVADGEDFTLTIYIQIWGNNAADIDLYDLVFIPIDEWAADLVDAQRDYTWGGRRTSDLGTYLDLDSITYPKVDTRALIRSSNDDSIFMPYATISGGKAMLQTQKHQRLYFLFVEQTGAIFPDTAKSYATATCRLTAAQRYLSMRGNR